jgi:hypothetical protein
MHLDREQRLSRPCILVRKGSAHLTSSWSLSWNYFRHRSSSECSRMSRASSHCKQSVRKLNLNNHRTGCHQLLCTQTYKYSISRRLLFHSEYSHPDTCRKHDFLRTDSKLFWSLVIFFLREARLLWAMREYARARHIQNLRNQVLRNLTSLENEGLAESAPFA